MTSRICHFNMMAYIITIPAANCSIHGCLLHLVYDWDMLYVVRREIEVMALACIMPDCDYIPPQQRSQQQQYKHSPTTWQVIQSRSQAPESPAYARQHSPVRRST